MLNKPSDADIEQIFEILGRHTFNLCGVCLEEDDNMNSNTVGWVACSACGLWVHSACVKDYCKSLGLAAEPERHHAFSNIYT